MKTYRCDTCGNYEAVTPFIHALEEHKHFHVVVGDDEHAITVTLPSDLEDLCRPCFVQHIKYKLDDFLK